MMTIKGPLGAFHHLLVRRKYEGKIECNSLLNVFPDQRKVRIAAIFLLSNACK